MSSHVPKISIIMPVYNSEKYLREAINSIINQTFKDYELIIIDDGSTDNSEKIIQSYLNKDKRIRMFKNHKEKGVAGALNTGMEKAKGTYFARADADDINRPKRLENQYNFLEKCKDIYLLGGGYAPFNENGHRINIIRSSSSLEIAWRFISDTYLCHPTVMFRKEIFDEFGGYSNEEAEDFSYFSKAIKKYKCSNLKEILIDYREHEKSRSTASAIGISESAKKTFYENYSFYTGSIDFCEIFYDFQINDKLQLKNLLKIFKINSIILNKIRKQYGLPLLSFESIYLQAKIFLKYLWVIFKDILRFIKKILKSLSRPVVRRIT